MNSVFLAVLATTTLLTNCAEVSTAAFEKRSGTPFEIVGSVLRGENRGVPHLSVADKTGGTLIVDITNDPYWKNIQDGDILRIRGIVQLSTNGLTSARCRQLTLIRHEDPPPPVTMDFPAFNAGLLDCRKVRVRGKLMEVFIDEIDPRYVYASLNCQGNIIYLTYARTSSIQDDLLRLRDAEVFAVGTVSSSNSNARRSLGRTIGCRSLASLTVVTPPPAHSFAVPPISTESSNAATEILSGGRRRAVGTVIAVRSGQRIYLRENLDATRCVKLATITTPNCGDKVEVAGLPETDFYRINLTDADWRLIATNVPPCESAKDCRIADLLTDNYGQPRITPFHHGQLIRLEGLIVDQPSVGSFQSTLMLKDGELVMPVELTSAKDVLNTTSVGCRIAVTGICIVETEIWRPTAGFPHATGVIIVPRKADDIVILARPSWWTPRRFLILVTFLFVLLIGILGWNRFLQAIIRRKSLQLMREQLAKVRSELRVSERTNLAVELHDALSQNLTGLAFLLATAKGAFKTAPGALPQHIETAERMLISCRTELKRCLSDLRDNTLDEKDFAVAIRRTLLPVVGDATMDIHFLVPRPKLDDTTAHSILCIIRELCANAVRHGHATRLTVRGQIDGQKLTFSVADNGCGFDPSQRPGFAVGHFGLDGVRERVDHLNGSLLINSAPGHGTSIVISKINL